MVKFLKCSTIRMVLGWVCLSPALIAEQKPTIQLSHVLHIADGHELRKSAKETQSYIIIKAKGRSDSSPNGSSLILFHARSELSPLKPRTPLLDRKGSSNRSVWISGCGHLARLQAKRNSSTLVIHLKDYEIEEQNAKSSPQVISAFRKTRKFAGDGIVCILEN